MLAVCLRPLRLLCRPALVALPRGLQAVASSWQLRTPAVNSCRPAARRFADGDSGEGRRQTDIAITAMCATVLLLCARSLRQDGRGHVCLTFWQTACKRARARSCVPVSLNMHGGVNASKDRHPDGSGTPIFIASVFRDGHA
eukprot:351691-Chlamydomonas_euryale.AAC.8